MSTGFTDESAREIRDIAERCGVGEGAALAMAEALAAGNGSMAQFNHPDLGGFGQWSAGGMLMIGDMFNDGLKHRVRSLAEALSGAARQGLLARGRAPGTEGGSGTGSGGFGQWWPDGLGTPSSSGAQNGRRYAVFPETRRLAVERDGRVGVHDTGDHRIGGVSQQQGGTSALRFTSQLGSVGIEDLPEVGDAPAQPRHEEADREPQAAKPPVQRQQQPAAQDARATASFSSFSGLAASTSANTDPGLDVVETLRRLAALRDDGILTDAEFGAKKTELLARL